MFLFLCQFPPQSFAPIFAEYLMWLMLGIILNQGNYLKSGEKTLSSATEKYWTISPHPGGKKVMKFL